MTTAINQKAYLQKYLTGVSGDKKKKKKKAVKGKGFKIIDDDIDLTKLQSLDGDELDILDGGEDAPQIAGIIDDRPEELKKQDQSSMSSKWRVISQDDGFNSKLKVEEIRTDMKTKNKENEVIFGKMYSDSEDEKQDSDASPPRKSGSKDRNEEKSKKHNSDSDFSPPRKRDSPKRDRKYDSDPSPQRTKSKSTEKVRKPSRWGDAESSTNHSRRRSPSSDASPPRKSQKTKYDSDASPPRKSRKEPFRNKNLEAYSSFRTKSPERPNYDQNRKYDSRKRRKSDSSDLSPPRKSHQRRKSPSPNRKSRKHSPEKNKRKHESDSDASPPRKEKDRRNGKDKRSPEKTKRRYESDSDASPPRREKDRKNVQDKRYQKRNSDSPPPTNKKMAKTLEGKTAGLQDARQLREENESFRKREEEVYNKMTDDVSGRNAQAVSRKGKRETSEDRQKQREKAERQKELDEKYKKWSKGIKQLEDQEARVQEFMHEAAKPLARHRDDRDLEHNLKQIERQGDPMLKYIREKKRERGEMGPEKPMYKGNFPPNRFNIRPGYRWDGVDRSNGYEKKYFAQQSKKKAQEEEAYKWSTEDL